MSEGNSIKIRERDKPFILALVASGITILNIISASIGAYLGKKEMVATSVDLLKYTFTLTATSWAFYFKMKPGTED